MAARRITGVALFLVITTVCAYAGWSAYLLPSADEQPAEQSAASAWPQFSNSAAKGDRLAAAKPMVLASLEPSQAPTAEPPLPAAEPPLPAAEQAAAVPALPSAMMLASVDIASNPLIELPRPSPRKVPAVAVHKPKAAPPSGLLDEGQIAGLRRRLKLTTSQAEYWPAVEAALRDVIRHQANEMRKKGGHMRGRAPRIDVNSAEVQQLISAAMPLLMQLREDQKHEVRQMARIIGLDQVARQI